VFLVKIKRRASIEHFTTKQSEYIIIGLFKRSNFALLSLVVSRFSHFTAMRSDFNQQLLEIFVLFISVLKSHNFIMHEACLLTSTCRKNHQHVKLPVSISLHEIIKQEIDFFKIHATDIADVDMLFLSQRFEFCSCKTCYNKFRTSFNRHLIKSLREISF
jgi:hypothetical protein